EGVRVGRAERVHVHPGGARCGAWSRWTFAGLEAVRERPAGAEQERDRRRQGVARPVAAVVRRRLVPRGRGGGAGDHDGGCRPVLLKLGVEEVGQQAVERVVGMCGFFVHCLGSVPLFRGPKSPWVVSRSASRCRARLSLMWTAVTAMSSRSAMVFAS